MVADNCHSSKRHKFVNFRLDFNSITSVFIVTRRLEKHSIFIFHDFLCVFWLLDRSCLHFFSIWFSACVFCTVAHICNAQIFFFHCTTYIYSVHKCISECTNLFLSAQINFSVHKSISQCTNVFLSAQIYFSVHKYIFQCTNIVFSAQM